MHSDNLAWTYVTTHACGGIAGIYLTLHNKIVSEEPCIYIYKQGHCNNAGGGYK